MKHVSIFFVFCLFAAISIFAQNTKSLPPKTIFEMLSSMDSTSNSSVIIHQDKRIEQLILTNESSGTRGFVYRVQVFSSNTQRTAKSEAFGMEKAMREAFPNQPIYVNYNSPSWKVRLGDFKTNQEAKDFSKKVVLAFPQLRSSIYTVRDKYK